MLAKEVCGSGGARDDQLRLCTSPRRAWWLEELVRNIITPLRKIFGGEIGVTFRDPGSGWWLAYLSASVGVCGFGCHCVSEV